MMNYTIINRGLFLLLLLLLLVGLLTPYSSSNFVGFAEAAAADDDKADDDNGNNEYNNNDCPEMDKFWTTRSSFESTRTIMMVKLKQSLMTISTVVIIL
jgi:hypothetical protein